MRLALLLSLGMVMLGCVSTPKPPQHPARDTCLTVYWHMIGMEVRSWLEPGRHYDDKEISTAINDLHEKLLLTGVTQRTVNACMQLNSQQVSCMNGVYTFEALSNCERLYAHKEHKQ